MPARLWVTATAPGVSAKRPGVQARVVHEGDSVASRLHATTIIRPSAPGAAF